MPKFKPGDKVYFPFIDGDKICKKVLTIEFDKKIRALVVRFIFSYVIVDNECHIFHATPENKAALEQLYGMEFEAV